MGPMGAPLPPPAELLNFKGPLLATAIGYIVVIVIGLAGYAIANSLFYIFIATILMLMACKSQTYIGQCVIPMMLLSGLTLFVDTVKLITVLGEPPGMSHYLSTNCSEAETHRMFEFQTSLVIVNDAQYSFPDDAELTITQNRCGHGWMLTNLSGLLGCFCDLAAVLIACRMWKAARPLVGGLGPAAGAGQPFIGGPAGPGASGPGDFGANPGAGAPFGGTQGGTSQGGPGFGGPAQPPRQPGFQPFQGTGQALSG